jgi:hypothetical protein
LLGDFAVRFNILILLTVFVFASCGNTSHRLIDDDIDETVVPNQTDELMDDPEDGDMSAEVEEIAENDEAVEDGFTVELNDEGADEDVAEDFDNTDTDADEVEERLGSISFSYNKSNGVLDFSLGGEFGGYGINEFLEVTRKISITEYVVEVSLRGGFIQHGHQVKAQLRVPFNADFPYEVEISDESSYVRLYAEGLGFIHERLGARGTVTVYSLKSSLTEVEELNFEGIDLEVFDKQ